MDASRLVHVGLIIILIGFFILLAGILSGDDVEAEGGAVIFIGPVPIVIGSDMNNAILAALFGLLAMAGFIWMRS